MELNHPGALEENKEYKANPESSALNMIMTVIVEHTFFSMLQIGALLSPRPAMLEYIAYTEYKKPKTPKKIASIEIRGPSEIDTSCSSVIFLCFVVCTMVSFFVLTDLSSKFQDNS